LIHKLAKLQFDQAKPSPRSITAPFITLHSYASKSSSMDGTTNETLYLHSA